MLLALGSPMLAEPSDEADLKRRSAALSELEARAAAIREELKRTIERRDAVTEGLRDVENAISEARAEVRDLEFRASAAKERTAQLDAEVTGIERELAVERAKLGLQLQAAYRFGPAAPMQILLDAESVDVSRRMVAYLGYLHRSRALRIAHVVSLSERARHLEAEAAAEQVQVHKLLTARRETIAEIERERDRRRQKAEEIFTTIADREQELERLARDKEELEILVGALQKDLVNRITRPPVEFVSRRGQLAWPVEGLLSASFGQPRGYGGARWTGVLIAAPTGREVKVVHDGTVVFAEWLRGFGLTLIIDHGESYLTIYSHNDAIYRKLGERVTEGEVIAEVGRSGGVDRDALYFEIRHRGVALDPSRWLARR